MERQPPEKSGGIFFVGRQAQASKITVTIRLKILWNFLVPTLSANLVNYDRRCILWGLSVVQFA